MQRLAEHLGVRLPASPPPPSPRPPTTVGHRELVNSPPSQLQTGGIRKCRNMGRKSSSNRLKIVDLRHFDALRGLLELIAAFHRSVDQLSMSRNCGTSRVFCTVSTPRCTTTGTTTSPKNCTCEISTVFTPLLHNKKVRTLPMN